MSATIKLKKGFDINLVGKAEKKVAEIAQPETFVLKPRDFKGLTRPKLLVKEGDNVKAGTPIYYDITDESVLYCAPVSGEIAEIKRGEKRVLLEVKILADKKVEFAQFKKYSVSEINSLSRQEVLEHAKKGGVWPQIIQRPFGIIADPNKEPKAIFISGFNTHPLSGDVAFQLEGEETAFQAGLSVLKKLTSGVVHLNITQDNESAHVFAQATNVQINKFSGPHPAGNVGVQIHHLNPINKGDVVWTVSPQGVVEIGKLFTQGIYDTSKKVAITGSDIKTPQYIKTYTGAKIDKLVADNVSGTHSRFISGNVLTGENAGKNGHLGFYHDQITVIPEGDKEEFLGWLLPSVSKLSFHRALGLLGSSKNEHVVDTNTNGEHRNFVVTGAFEKVMPMDILPTHLFKAIIANDYDNMEALGLLELVEEDVALCEFIDVSKNNIQGILRDGIDLIRNS